MKLQILIIAVVLKGLSTPTRGQDSNKIIHTQTDTENLIEFRSVDNNVIRIIDVNKNNQYSNFHNISARVGQHGSYLIQESEKLNIIDSFFVQMPKERNWGFEAWSA